MSQWPNVRNSKKMKINSWDSQMPVIDRIKSAIQMFPKHPLATELKTADNRIKELEKIICGLKENLNEVIKCDINYTPVEQCPTCAYVIEELAKTIASMDIFPDIYSDNEAYNQYYGSCNSVLVSASPFNNLTANQLQNAQTRTQQAMSNQTSQSLFGAIGTLGGGGQIK